MPQQTQHQQVRPHRHPHPATTQQTSLDRHRRKCAVCHHPERESIEEEFLLWHNPVNIVHEFKLGDRRILYRHAHATGLYEQRRRNYLFTIENVLECGDDIEFTAAAYIKAVRAYACLCDTVRWTEPAVRLIFSNDSSRSGNEPSSSDSLAGTPSLGEETAVPRSSSSLPDPPAPDDALCGSGLQPRHNARPNAASSRERLEGRGSSSTPPLATSRGGASAERDSTERSSSSLPQAASHSRAPSALSSHESQAANHAPAKNQQAGASSSFGPVSSADSGEKFLAAAIPLLGAKPKHVAQLKKAGLLHLAELAARQVSPPSNRHTPELETAVSHGKQRSEVVSNRHKITK